MASWIRCILSRMGHYAVSTIKQSVILIVFVGDKMKKVKYMITSYSPDITRVEVQRESECMVWVNTEENIVEQYNKTSVSRIFCDTWDEARYRLIQRCQNRKAYFQKQLEKLESEIDALVDMTQ